MCRKLLIAGFASALLFFAQPPPPDKAKAVIDRALTALGGERFLNMQSRTATARIYSFFKDETNGADVARIYTAYDPQKPAHGLAVRERELLGKKQDYSYLFLADQGFDVTFRGARPIPDESWERYQRATENNILYILRYRRNEPGMQFDFVGSEVYLTNHVEVVDVTDSTGFTIRVSFNHNTSLPVRQTYSWLDPVTRQRNDEGIYFDKWRDIGGGVMWPFTIERERNGYKTYQMFASEVTLNQPLPPKIFDLPPGARVLKKVN
jgi:hypothetical protein